MGLLDYLTNTFNRLFAFDHDYELQKLKEERQKKQSVEIFPQQPKEEEGQLSDLRVRPKK